MSEGYQIVICDAGPIIHLDELDQLSLLNDFGAVYIPKQVWDEVRLHRPQALSKAGPRFHKIDVPLVYESTFQSISKSFSLDLGEQAALMLMQEYPEAIFLTDDAAARLAAVTLGYRVHGSIGILLRAIRRKQLSEVEVIKILRELPNRSSLHIRPGVLANLDIRSKSS
jgi:predicted nucleic acid-binding protein